MNSRRTLASVLSTLALTGMVGCGDHDHDHDHAHGDGKSGGGGHKHGSRQGGVAVELGEHQYQLDVVLDGTAGALNAWVMDGHMENFVRIPAASIPVTVRAGGATNTVILQAVANASTGETVGDTSQFRGEAPWLKGLTAFQAVVDDLEVRGNRFRGVTFSYPESGH